MPATQRRELSYDIFLLMGKEKAQNDSRQFLSSSSLGNQSIDSHPPLHGPPDSALLKQLTYRKFDPWIKKALERKKVTLSVWRIYY